ncbi:hypothetical protein HYW46_02830 [Candidatus Daviesbacteria bacterium]|nr:hypothetical protein [Candidatus Daviesbacteria bacterium]
MEPTPEKNINNEIQPGIITAPFTSEQVEALNFYQQSGVWHPFTCGYPHKGLDFSPTLTAADDGWYCEISGCNYTQNWAHSAMADRKLIEDTKRVFEESAKNAKKLKSF